MINWYSIKKASEFTPEALEDLDYYKDYTSPEELKAKEKRSQEMIKRDTKDNLKWYKPNEMAKGFAEEMDYSRRLKEKLDDLRFIIHTHFPVDSTLDPSLRIDNMPREKLLQNIRRVLSYDRYNTKGASDVKVSPIYANFDKYKDHGVSSQDWKLLIKSIGEARKASPNIDDGYSDEWKADEAITNGIPLRVTSNKKPVGAMALRGGLSDSALDIAEFGILPEHQNKGIGREALKEAIKHILERRKSEWTYPWGIDYHKGIAISADEANDRANHLYSTFGFKKIENYDHSNNYYMPFDKAEKLVK